MSTYEALIDMHGRMVVQFKKLCEEGEELIQITDKILALIDCGVVDLGGPYLSRVEMATRRFRAGQNMGSETIGEIDSHLRSLEGMRVRRDVAGEIGDHQLARDQENLMAKLIPMVHSELENVFTLIEYLKLALKELAPPRLIVG